MRSSALAAVMASGIVFASSPGNAQSFVFGDDFEANASCSQPIVSVVTFCIAKFPIISATRFARITDASCVIRSTAVPSSGVGSTGDNRDMYFPVDPHFDGKYNNDGFAVQTSYILKPKQTFLVRYSFRGTGPGGSSSVMCKISGKILSVKF